MRKNFGANPMSYPQPVFVIGSYDEKNKPDAMVAAWGGISDSNEITIHVVAIHKTIENILKRKAFTVSMADEAHIDACDYVGIVSANDVPDKFEKAGFHATKSSFVDAPLIDELPMALECKLKSYNKENSHLVGEIVNVCVDESVLNESGSVDLTKFRPVTYDPINNTYHVIGEKVGTAFESGTKLM